MWDPQRLTNLWAFMACYRDIFTIYFRETNGLAVAVSTSALLSDILL
jgi:hypothetical protein